MIGKITGTLSYKEIDHILLDVNGLGYEVFLSESTLAKIPLTGKKISVYTELIVREDLLQLVGFATRNEREWYRLLTGVQGVGSKAALKILGTFQVSSLSRSIITGDANAIKATPGIGPKIAQRIISELQDKVPSLMAMGSETSYNQQVREGMHSPQKVSSQKNMEDPEIDLSSSSEEAESISNQAQAEALSALINLGYSSHEAALAVTAVLREREGSIEVQKLIKFALRNLSPKV